MSPALQQKKLLAVLLSSRQDTDRRIMADQEARRAPAIATRPLLDHEHTARVMFADIEEDLDAALLEATVELERLHEDVKATVLTALFGEDREPRTPDEAHEVIHALTQDEPPQIEEQESSAALIIAGLLAATYLAGGRRVTEEAQRQGVDTASVNPAELDAEEFMEQARAVSQHPWRRITRKVEDGLSRQSVLTQDTVTPGEVDMILDGIRIDGSRDEARQAINTSGGRGRIDTVESAPELQPDRIWSSEIMDGAQCDRCELIDGREFTDMEEARGFYRSGHYYRCRGGARCRGTLVFRFSE